MIDPAAQRTLDDTMAKLLAIGVRPQLVRNNARFKKIDFQFTELQPIPQTPDYQGFMQTDCIVFTGHFTFDSEEGKVSSWDYDEDGDKEASIARHLDDKLSKILS